MKRGVLFRSAAFHEASEADIARLDELGVRVLVDLRRPEERAGEPNRWPGEGVRTIINDEGNRRRASAASDGVARRAILARSRSLGYMHELYRAFAFEPRHIELYRAWFRELAAGEGAAVIHCAAGKDRTGLGCALTLMALGVQEEAVFADYEFTNQAVDIEARLPRIKARMEERLARTLDADALRPMLGVHADYLRTSLDAIEAKHGTVTSYMDEVLGVGAGERDKLLAKLTWLARDLPLFHHACRSSTRRRSSPCQSPFVAAFEYSVARASKKLACSTPLRIERQPRDRVFGDAVDLRQAELTQAPIGDVADVLLDIVRRHALDRAHLEGEVDELVFHADDGAAAFDDVVLHFLRQRAGFLRVGVEELDHAFAVQALVAHATRSRSGPCPSSC